MEREVFLSSCAFCQCLIFLLSGRDGSKVQAAEREEGRDGGARASVGVVVLVVEAAEQRRRGGAGGRGSRTPDLLTCFVLASSVVS